MVDRKDAVLAASGITASINYLVYTGEAPVFNQAPRQTVEEALRGGPKYFRELMEATGSNDGREIVRELERFYGDGSLGRNDDGKYELK